MFGFGKKQNKSLLVMGTDVIEIIRVGIIDNEALLKIPWGIND